MKPRPFTYLRPRTLTEACDALERHGDDAKLLAGGQSLIAAMNMRLAAPSILINVAAIEELQGIRLEGGALRIGAMTRHVEVLDSPQVAEHAPLLAEAMPHIAHPAIRNRGTFGGSLCHADPAAELPACALALAARFEIHSSRGTRTVDAEQFFLGTYTTTLSASEILVAVHIPGRDAQRLSFFDEIARRRGDYAMAGLAACAHLREGRFADARFAFFGVADKPLSARSARGFLEGRRPEALDIEQASRALCADIEPMPDLTTSAEAKAHLMRVLAGRALRRFAGEGA